MRFSDWSSDVCSSDLSTAWGQSLSGMVVGNEVVKAALATTTFARMLASSDRVLAAGAGEEGRAETERLCTAMADENERFETDLEAMLPSLTAQYLARETSGPGGNGAMVEPNSPKPTTDA